MGNFHSNNKNNKNNAYNKSTCTSNYLRKLVNHSPSQELPKFQKLTSFQAQHQALSICWWRGTTRTGCRDKWH